MKFWTVEQMIDAAHVPIVRPAHIHIGHGLIYGGRLSYYEAEYDTLWLLPGADRWELFHELGHVFDRKLLTPADRDKLRHQLGGKWRRWFWGNWNPMTHRSEPFEERFADAYADAALHKRRRRRLRRFLEEVYAR